ncbi:MAG: aldehyde dehydrogenase [Synechococcales cyanobacterium]
MSFATPQSDFSPLSQLVHQQRAFFNSQGTKAISFRIEQLKRLKRVIIEHQDAILESAKADLGRPAFEAYFEIATITEINGAIRQVTQWAKPQRVKSSIDQFPSTAWIQPEPLGVVLIIGPWNYPFQLIMSPLVGAIAAGNCAILKPSEYAPHTSSVLARLIRLAFEPSYIALVEGDVTVSQALLQEKFDHIFFTGSPKVGRLVMAAAAQYLTPVTLELGGKSPCIVEPDSHLGYAAKRIAWGKLINAGQTCIAPDYLLVHHHIKSQFIELLKESIHTFYGSTPHTSPDYGRIVNQSHLHRLSQYLGQGRVILGGEFDPDTRYFAPTLLDEIGWDDPIMEEEIFGPILPILGYDELKTAIAQINLRPKPLALYFFSSDRQKQSLVVSSTSSGGVCINDTVMHIAVNQLPFGGVGESGMGAYHGKASFDCFSHFKSVLKRSFWLDLNWRYAPYTTQKVQQIKQTVTR